MLIFQAVAEKTAKNFRGLLFCRTLYNRVILAARYVSNGLANITRWVSGALRHACFNVLPWKPLPYKLLN